MKKSTVRRALTSLAKQGVINQGNVKILDFEDGKVRISFIVDSELIQPKKRIYNRKLKTL